MQKKGWGREAMASRHKVSFTGIWAFPRNEDANKRAWELFEYFASVFTGYVDCQGRIIIFSGRRSVSRYAVCELCLEACRRNDER